MSEMISIDGLVIELTKKRIKRMNMRIKEHGGRIVISAPYGISDAEIVRFVRDKRRWIDRNVARIQAREKAYPRPETRAEKEAMRRALKLRIAVRLPYIEEVTGLRANGWTVRDMHTRWGSCNTKTHHINLSLMLASRTDDELDYVILHELVHTVVPGHGADFYAMMDRYMPDWKGIRAKLR